MIRSMSREDLDAVVLMEQENFSEPWTKEGFLDAIESEQTIFLVCEHKGVVVGYIGAYLVYDEAQITNVSVGKNWQGKGFGRMLVSALSSAVAGRDIHAITLEVRVSNERAISIYEKEGFVSEGIRPGFYSHPKEDAMIMWKR